MTSKRTRARDSAPEDFEAGLDAFFRPSRRKQNKRKNRQLCSQVRRALSSALCADFEDTMLNELWIVKVEPAPTLSRLMVWVEGPQGSSAELIHARLLGVAGALRAEVATAIHRKQVPTLAFAVCHGRVRA
jgi:ribosome-binding factor A